MLWFKADGMYPARGLPHNQLLNMFSLAQFDIRREYLSHGRVVNTMQEKKQKKPYIIIHVE